MEITWAQYYFFFMYLVTVPLYVCLLWKMYKRRNTTKFSRGFLALLISQVSKYFLRLIKSRTFFVQGIVDLLYLNSLLLFGVSSYILLSSDEVLFSLNVFCVAMYKCLLCAVYLRSFGVLLMSFQRYLTICRWRSWLNAVSLL